MIKWFTRRVKSALEEIAKEEKLYYSDRSECVDGASGRSVSRSPDERITVTVEKVIGGHVAAVSKYNRRVDRYTENTYIINDVDDFAEAITAVLVQEKISQ